MNFKTLVELPRKELKMTHKSRLMLFGSCFAENIGKLLTENKFKCDVNSFGVLYNPFSIAGALDEIVAKRRYGSDDLFAYQGRWHSYMHHSSFSNISKEVCLSNINSRLKYASEVLSQTDCLLITFGTAYVYRQKDSGKVVGNCHKLPEIHFERRLATVSEITERFSTTIFALLNMNPNIKLLFTVSPIRHVKDGMHGNQLSKSILLLSINQLKEAFSENVFYFPAYELMIDELRDYRFYADDMLHPSPMAIEYIWECFVNCYFPEETVRLMQEWQNVINALNHKPFDSSSEKYKSFLMQNVLNIERVKEKYPFLDVEKEMELCHTLLRR